MVVVSHDNRYYHVADRVITLKYSKIISEDVNGSLSELTPQPPLLRREGEQETPVFEGITHLLEGFKELRLNARKSDAFFQKRLTQAYTRLTLRKLTALRYMIVNFMLVYGAGMWSSSPFPSCARLSVCLTVNTWCSCWVPCCDFKML